MFAGERRIHRLEFEIERRGRHPWLDRPYDTVTIRLAGTDLRDAIARRERDLGYGDQAGKYDTIDAAHDWAAVLAGASSATDRSGRVPLLGCSCTIVDDWPLYARVDVGPDEVTWSDFTNPQLLLTFIEDRDGPTDLGFGPLVFARPGYDAAVADLVTARAALGYDDQAGRR